MPQFKITVLNSGKSRVHKLTASNASEARSLGAQYGRVLNVKRALAFSLKRGMSANERYLFFVRLGTMVGSKMGLSEALQLMGETFTGRIGAAASSLHHQVNMNSMQPATAFSNDTRNFPPATIALLNAGFKAGNTPLAFQTAADYEDKMRSLSKGKTLELASQILTYFVGVILIVASTHWIAPKMEEMGVMVGAAELDVSIYVFWSWLVEILSFVGAGLLMALLFLNFVVKRLAPVFADKVISYIPYFRDLVLSRDNYIIFFKLALLLKNGLQLSESLILTCDTAPKGLVKNDLQKAISNLQHGVNWVNDFTCIGPTEKAALASSGSLSDTVHVVELISKQYITIYASRLEMIVPLFKVLNVVFIVSIGVVVFAMTTLPMADLFDVFLG
ncbi:type II secretion system F family protein [Pseudovibrio ascidiaceicola]|uniref:type II secretion system F family protein n=1 Tax=Pseudovibrio ascidiaceicola TaxID=285279 RepID=UPI003D364CD2